MEQYLHCGKRQNWRHDSGGRFERTEVNCGSCCWPVRAAGWCVAPRTVT